MKLRTTLLGFLLLFFLPISNANAQQEGFIGEVKLFAGNFAPRGWAFCDGQLLAISSNTALFSILGTMYGGDGRSTFALPDLRSRTPIGVGTGPGLSTIQQGERGGQENITLTALELPSHNHGLSTATLDVKIGVNNENGESSTPAGEVIAGGRDAYIDEVGSNQFLGGVTSSLTGNTTNSGSNRSFDNRNPFLGIRYIICLNGLFPSRN